MSRRLLLDLSGANRVAMPISPGVMQIFFREHPRWMLTLPIAVECLQRSASSMPSRP